jgi:hypothetical protein
MARPYQRDPRFEYCRGVRAGIVALALVATPATASAGRTFYGWLYGTEVMPERGAELTNWIAETNAQDPDNASETRWNISAAIGITDQLELQLPVQIAWDRANDVKPHTAFDRWGAELRYRFVSADPEDAPPIVPLLRVAVLRSVLDRETWIPQVDFVVSYEQGRVHVLADLGGYAELTTCSGRTNCSNSEVELQPGAGFSIRAVGDLRFGAEFHAERPTDGGGWAVAGPNVAWSHGRTWLSAAYGIGITGIRDAPRLQWGIAF